MGKSESRAEKKNDGLFEMDSNCRETDSWSDDLIINILKRVTVKTLIRLKCVSKDWKKLIETPYFITLHRSQSASNNASLLLHRIPRISSFSLIGPDFQVRNLDTLDDFIPHTVKIVGSCNGLLLIRHTNDHNILSLWNPATRQVNKVTGTLIGTNNFLRIGFGFCSIVNDYKIVRIAYGNPVNEQDSIVEIVDEVKPYGAEAYSLTTGSWRQVNIANLQDFCITPPSVTANGAIFWLATLNSDSNRGFVVSFDIRHEMFTVLKAPPSMPDSPNCFFNDILSVSNDKLVVFRNFIVGNFESSFTDLWVMEDASLCEAGEEGWSKKCRVGPCPRMFHPICIWRDEIVCREERQEPNGDRYRGVKTVLSLYNASSNELRNMPVQRYEFYFSICNYAESLVSVGNIHHQL